MTGHIVGSPEFMAPEQFHDGTVDARSDIYSLGRTFAYLLNGNIPTKLKRILAKMTAGLSEQRFQTADELILVLNRALNTPKWKVASGVLVLLSIIVSLLFLWRSDHADSLAALPH